MGSKRHPTAPSSAAGRRSWTAADGWVWGAGCASLSRRRERNWPATGGSPGTALGGAVRHRSAREKVESVGPIGWLPRRLVTREEAHSHAVAAAPAPFLPGA